MNFAIKVIAACAVVAGASGVFAQVSGPMEPHNVVQLASSGVVDVQQDWLAVTMGSTKDGADPASVQAQVRQALETALTEAKKTEQPGAMEVHTGAFNLQPRYGRDGKITGWVGSAELVLEGRDFVRIGAAAGKIQTLVVSGTAFSLSREARSRFEGQAQEMAIDRFKVKANDIARSFGFGGYTLRQVSVSANDQNVGPRPRFMAAEMKTLASDAAVPLEAGKTSVVVNVSGSVQLK
ncbi:MAG: SIMPL domain-containing protein [Rhodoferax sp.]